MNLRRMKNAVMILIFGLTGFVKTGQTQLRLLLGVYEDCLFSILSVLLEALLVEPASSNFSFFTGNRRTDKVRL